MFCLNTLHEAVCETLQKGAFLAYSWGNVNIPPCPGTGGSCWAEAKIGKTNVYISSNVYARIILNGKISVSAALPKFQVFLEVYTGDELIFSEKKLECTDNKTFSNDEYLLASTSSLSAGYYDVYVRFRGEASAVGEGNYAAIEFNNRYGGGYYVEVIEIF